MSVIGTLRRIGRRLVYGGTRRFRPYEALVLQHALPLLTAPDQEALRQQIAHVETIQRHLKDRMVAIFFGHAKAQLPRLTTTSEEECCAQVRLKASRTTVTASVILWDGLLRSIEFSRSPRGLDATTEVLSAALGGRPTKLAAAADRLEHGR